MRRSSRARKQTQLYGVINTSQAEIDVVLASSDEESSGGSDVEMSDAYDEAENTSASRRNSTKKQSRASSAKKSRASAARKKKQQQQKDDDEDEEMAAMSSDSDTSEDEDDEVEDADMSLAIERGECALFDAISNRGTSVKSFVGPWLRRYNDEATREEALTALTNAIVRATGCEATLSADRIAEDDHAELVEELAKQDVADQEDGPARNRNQYPLVSRSKVYRDFESRWREFWRRLIDATKGNQLHDDTLIHHISEWLGAVSAVGRRSFRHTATVAAYEVISALTRVLAKEQKEAAVLHRQHEAEGRKARPNAKTLKQLEGAAEQADGRVEAVASFITELYEATFVHRFRDTYAPIRTLSMEALGEWLALLPEFWRKDCYIKHLGWGLSDADATTRAQVLDVLIALYSEPANLESLNLFTERFMQRFAQMQHDVDTRVATLGVDFLTLLLKEHLLGDAELGVASLIWEPEPEIAKAAARFVYRDIFMIADEDATVNQTTASQAGNRPTDPKQRLKQAVSDVALLMEVFDMYCPGFKPSGADEDEDEDEDMDAADADATGAPQCDVPTCAAMLVEAFWPVLPRIRDWEALTQCLLLSEAGAAGVPSSPSGGSSSAAAAASAAEGALQIMEPEDMLSERLQVVLSHVILAAARRATTGSALGQGALLLAPSDGKKKRRKKRGASSARHTGEEDVGDVQAVASSCTDFLVDHLPTLVSTFQADSNKLRPLVQLARCIPHSSFSQSRRTSEQQFGHLLQSLTASFLKLSDPLLLSQICATLAYLADESQPDHTLAGEAVTAAKTLANEAVAKLKALDADTSVSFASPVERAMLLTAVHRVRFLHAQFGFENTGFDTDLELLLMGHIEDDAGDVEIVETLFAHLVSDIGWRYSRVDPEALGDDADEVMRPIAALIDSAGEFLTKMLQRPGTQMGSRDWALRVRAFSNAAHLFVSFSHKLAGTVLDALAMRPDETLRRAFVAQFKAMVRVHPEERVDEEEEDEEEVDEEVATRNAVREATRVSAFAAAGRVVAFAFGEHPLLTRVFLGSYLQYGDACDAIVKKTMTLVRQQDEALLLALQLGALQWAFTSNGGGKLRRRSDPKKKKKKRVKSGKEEASEDDESEDEEEEEEEEEDEENPGATQAETEEGDKRGAEAAEALAKKFVLLHKVNPNKRSFAIFLRDGTRFALKQAPANLAFFPCLLPYVKRASARDLRYFVQMLSEAASEALREGVDQREQKRWKYLDEFQQDVVQRTSRVFGDTGLDDGMASMLMTPSRTGKRMKMSPAPSAEKKRKAVSDDEGEEDVIEEEEEEEEEDVVISEPEGEEEEEEEEEVKPTPPRRKKRRTPKSSGRRGGRGRMS